ncbi:hypothetical protein [Coleofasciculus sp. G2-EDA-02]|uniref:hypothetical protein n=1 Tax=Coleofasciculus sp. G2-EDA-02 TaxID=3069529 RepID=UPI003300695E
MQPSYPANITNRLRREAHHCSTKKASLFTTETPLWAYYTLKSNPNNRIMKRPGIILRDAAGEDTTRSLFPNQAAAVPSECP